MQPLTVLVIALTMSVAMVVATEEACNECHWELQACTAPCRDPDVWIVPPTCNGVECLDIFNKCWDEHCIIPNKNNDDGVNVSEGSGDIDGN